MKRDGFAKRLAVLLALWTLSMLLLPGCQKEIAWLEKPKQNVQNVEDGMISGIRTGIIRQGISGQFKSFECTDKRVYFMTNIGGMPMLYSSTHDSTQLEPLCFLEGCEHEGPGCNAFFGVNGNVCYYNEFLYVDAGTRLYRMNADGSERMLLLDIAEAFEEEDYDGIAEPKLWNGVFTFYLTEYVREWSDTWERTVLEYVPYYYKLDGSMRQPEPMVQLEAGVKSLITQYNDGSQFIMRGPGQQEKADEYLLYTWNPETNEYAQFADVTMLFSEFYEPWLISSREPMGHPDHILRWYEAVGEGYWGTDCAYYLQREEEGMKITNNVLCRLDYFGGTSQPLLNTGLEGAYRLCCFPDCFVMIETVNNSWNIPATPRMYIYSWDMQLIGECTLEYELGIMPQDVICGETANRIYLAARFTGVPEYYIDKADFETGEIVVRELTYSNADLDAVYATSYDAWETYDAEEEARLEELFGGEDES